MIDSDNRTHYDKAFFDRAWLLERMDADEDQQFLFVDLVSKYVEKVPGVESMTDDEARLKAFKEIT